MSIHHQTTRGGPASRPASPHFLIRLASSAPHILWYPGGTPTTTTDPYEDLDPVPDTTRYSGSRNGNGDASDSIISLINHYSAFSETIAANSAMASSGALQSIPKNSAEGKKTHPVIRYAVSDDTPLIPTKIPRDSLVIAAMPAFNEERAIAKTILAARKFVDRVLIVDDGSTDATAEIAEALGAIVIRHTTNKGYGGALATIFATARHLGAEELVILDADGQHDPEFIPELLEPIRKGVDIVIGSRFLRREGNDIPGYRILGMKILDTATNFAGDIRVSDTQSGFRAYGKRAIQAIKVSGNGMSAGSEILLQVKDHGFSVAEVPITVRYDLENTSSQHPVSHGMSVLSKIIGMVGYRRPLISFGIPGFILTLIGMGASLFTVTKYVTGGPLHTVMFVGGITSLILGLLLMTTGLILNSLVQVMKIGRMAD